MFIINVTPYIQQETLPDNTVTWCLLGAQALPVLVLASWVMGLLINRTAHAWFSVEQKGKSKRDQKDSSPGISFASFQANEAHAFLYPMIGYVLISLIFLGAMVAFTKFWDDGLSVSFAPEAIVMVLGNLLAWILVLYLYTGIILSAPIIVLHRKGVIQAMRMSYNLAKDDQTRWELLALLIFFLMLGALLDLGLEMTVLRGIFGNYDNTKIAYCVHFNVLLILLLPLYSSVLTAQYYSVKLSERIRKQKRGGDDIGLMGFEVD
ncbi:unnamed protein product [Cylindrotheca closterium]|uniref:Uncharacterized protein n=1 Tax=Cylindrotheca closterium TaxID=2856 RepID=A0AAD2G3C1_9STRA|nr:unnamed protein product [Cylindrotheca closterium]